MKNVVTLDAASKATVLSMGSLELLLRVSVFAVLDLTTLLREVLGVGLSDRVWAGKLWLVLGVCLQL